MNRLLAACLSLTTLCAATFAVAADPAPLVIRFSHVVGENTPKGQGALLLRRLVEERLAGKVRVEIHPDGTLFDDATELKALQDGKVEMLAPSLAKFSEHAPQLQVFDLPFLFDDMAAVDRFQQRPVGRQLLLSMTASNIIGLGYWHNGMKQLSATRALQQPADARGLAFRIQNSPVSLGQFAALQARGVPLPFSQMRAALQSGEVEGAENPWSNFTDQRLDVLQPFVTETNHGVLDYMLVSNARFWYSIPHELRSELEDIIAEVSHEVNQQAASINEQARASVLAAGKTQVISLTPAQREQWKAAMQPVWQQYELLIGPKVVRAALRANRAQPD